MVAGDRIMDSGMHGEKGVAAGYEKLAADTKVKLGQADRTINRLSLARLVVILGGAALVFAIVQTESITGVLLVSIGLVVLFAGLVNKQSKAEREQRSLRDFLAINENELSVRDGKANLYDDGARYADPKHPYTDDLDIFGDNSLYARINRCATRLSNDQLAAWLSEPAEEAEIRARQEAAEEMAALPGWGQGLQRSLFFEVKEKTDIKSRFAGLMADRSMDIGGRFLRGYVRLAPWLFAAAVISAFFVPALLRVGVVLGVAHLMVSLWYAGKIGRVSGNMDRAGRLLVSYAEAFRQVEETPWKSGRGQALASRLKFGPSKPASVVFSELAALVNKLDYRLNMLIGALLNMVFLWDLKQVYAIATWRKQYKDGVMDAFMALAEFETLNTLGILRTNHPDWVMPSIHPSGERVLVGEAVGHPLIAQAESVANDYALEGHRIALITGSNMAGKSTFLRTVGVNIVLALAGGVVCARRMSVSVCRLVTYMRIKDSLNENTSTFKAELDRMQLILATVKSQPHTFFLIDEMLRGTNSVDKYLGSKAIIQQLIAYDGYGMVATHDLKLAELEAAHPQVIRNYHFDIQVSEGEMLFDYKLKRGECTIFNASLLLRRIGVHVSDE